MTKTVKIILLSDVPQLGQKDDVKAVSMGYAKNWLIRLKLAAVATPQMIANAEKRKILTDQRQKEHEAQYDVLLKELEGFTLRMRPKKNKQGTLYEGIDATVIAEKLKEKKITIDPKFIQLEEHIKQVGEYEVPVIFSKDLQSKIKVIVQ